MKEGLHGAATTPAHGGSAVPGLGVLDGFVHGQDETGGLAGCCQSVLLDDSRLPDTVLKVVTTIFLRDVYTEPAFA